MPRPARAAGEHVALRGATHHHRALPRDRVAPARQPLVRQPVGEADDAVALPFVAPFGEPPPRGVVARGVEAGAEPADLAPDQILFAAVHRPQHDIGLAAAHAGRIRMGDDFKLDMVMRAQERTELRHQPVRGERRADRQLDDAARLRAASPTPPLPHAAPPPPSPRHARETCGPARSATARHWSARTGECRAGLPARRSCGRPSDGWSAAAAPAAAKLRVSATATKVLHRSQSIGASRARCSFLINHLFNIERPGACRPAL